MKTSIVITYNNENTLEETIVSKYRNRISKVVSGLDRAISDSLILRNS